MSEHPSTPASSRPLADWSATQYLKFATQRNRPIKDLLAQIPLTNPRRIVDLGCGPGNSTQALIERYPAAETIYGLDSSPDMLAKARASLPHIQFVQGDLSTWTPGPEEDDVDLLFSNAVFHWLQPDPVSHMARLLEASRSGTVLALQVPDNYLEPSHVVMRETAASPGPWSAVLAPLKPALDPMPRPRVIYERLSGLCAPGGLDVWHTFYYHVLDGPEEIVEWVKGSGLRPFIDPLEKGAREEFLRKYTERIAEVYPRMEDEKVLLRYPRLFVVAVRK